MDPNEIEDNQYSTKDSYFNEHSYKWKDRLFDRYYVREIKKISKEDFKRIKKKGNFNEAANDFLFQCQIEFQERFLLLLESLHDVYFFVLDNPNKPNATIVKINAVFDKKKLDEREKLDLLDQITALLFFHPNKDQFKISYEHINAYREYLLPRSEDEEFLDRKEAFDKQLEPYTWDHFSFMMQQLKQEYKQAYYIKRLIESYNESVAARRLNEYEIGFIESSNFFRRVEVELERILPKAEKQIEALIPDQKTEDNKQESKTPDSIYSGVHVERNVFESIFKVLSLKVTEDEHENLRTILSGKKIDSSIHFNGMASQLADLFGKAYKAKKIGANSAKAIDQWLAKYFYYFQKGEYKPYKTDSQIELIRQERGKLCKNPLINIENGKIVIIDN